MCFAKCTLTWEPNVKRRKIENPTDVLPPGDTGIETHKTLTENSERSPCVKQVEKIFQIFLHTKQEPSFYRSLNKRWADLRQKKLAALLKWLRDNVFPLQSEDTRASSSENLIGT